MIGVCHVCGRWIHTNESYVFAKRVPKVGDVEIVNAILSYHLAHKACADKKQLEYAE